MEEKILIINTGGTFNKKYDPISGALFVEQSSQALASLAAKWLCDLKSIDIIGKDSLEMTNHDRLELLATIHQSPHEKIIIIHGTDTMHITAEYLADADLEKQVVLTGAMVPYSIDPVEATANFASAYGYLLTLGEDGIYIAMNGIIASFKEIRKDREKGKFTRVLSEKL
jgi:L-asparaginase